MSTTATLNLVGLSNGWDSGLSFGLTRPFILAARFTEFKRPNSFSKGLSTNSQNWFLKSKSNLHPFYYENLSLLRYQLDRMSWGFTIQSDSVHDTSSSLSDIWKQFPIKSLERLERFRLTKLASKIYKNLHHLRTYWIYISGTKFENRGHIVIFNSIIFHLFVLIDHMLDKSCIVNKIIIHIIMICVISSEGAPRVASLLRWMLQAMGFIYHI